MLRHQLLLALVLLHILTVVARADEPSLSLASIFSDHMVLQREMDDPVWGRAKPGAKIDVAIGKQSHQATADGSGKWHVKLDPLQVSDKPLQLVVRSGKESITVNDVLVGDVWLASGQSNMALWVGMAKDAEKEVADANWPLIRTLTVPNTAADEPAESFPAAPWQAVTPKTIPSFSAVAYFFGRELHSHLHIPIGLIACDVGATGMECWTSRAALEAASMFKQPTLESFANPLKEKNPAEYKRTQYFMPARLFNGMVHPLIPFGIRGMIWYQGESNSDRPQDYVELTRTMLTDWRWRWGQGDFPFLFVQLPGFVGGYENWRPFREAQEKCLAIPNTGMAVAIDVGERADIHPKDKQSVGKRLALVARRLSYGEDVVDSGPKVKSVEFKDGKARVSFNHVGGGLKVKGDLTGFEIAGADLKYVPGKAAVDGDQVAVWSDAVPAPKAIRYDWTDYPIGNLYNAEGLPAWPFRAPVDGAEKSR